MLKSNRNEKISWDENVEHLQCFQLQSLFRLVVQSIVIQKKVQGADEVVFN